MSRNGDCITNASRRPRSRTRRTWCVGSAPCRRRTISARSGRSGCALRQACEAEVERAVAERSFVRTWPLRGTLHFVAAEDVRWMLELLGARTIARDARQVQAARTGRGDVRQNQPARSHARSQAASNSRARSWPRRSTARGVADRRPAAPTPAEQVFAGRPDLLSPRGAASSLRSRCSTSGCRRRKGLGREEALAELALRYFTSRGPATLQDFVWWSGLTTADARAGLETAKPRLQRRSSTGRLTGSPRPRRRRKTRRRRLPAPGLRRIHGRLQRPQRRASPFASVAGQLRRRHAQPDGRRGRSGGRHLET